MRKLLAYQFQWILPGHGDRGCLPPGRMKEEMSALVERMQQL